MKTINHLLISLSLIFSTLGFAQKVVVVGMNHVSPDGLSFVATQTISSGEIIYFSEDEYNNATNAFSSGESVTTFTATTTINVGDVVFIKETATNTLTVSCTNGVCGTAVVTTVPFALGSGGEQIYAYSDTDADPTNGVTEIYSVMYTIAGNIPALEDPIVDFPNAIVVDGFGSGAPDRTEFNASRDGVSKTILENPANYTNGAANADLNIAAFTNLNLSGTNPVLTLSTSAASSAENSGGSFVFTFTLDSPAVGNLTVNFTYGGSADESTDYSQSGADTFAAGSGTATISGGTTTTAVIITPSGDTDLEPDETVVLTIAAGTGYDAGSPSQATSTILNDDTIILPALVAVTGTSHSGTEGFSFVALTDITPGTQVYFTDNEFDNSSLSFNTGESTVLWQLAGDADVIPRGTVIVASENSPDTFTLSCGGLSCGGATVVSGSFDLSSEGESFSAYSDSDSDGSNGILQLYSTLYTGPADGSIPSSEDPTGVYTASVLVDGFSVDPILTEYNPALRNVQVDQANFQNISNWIHPGTAGTLSDVPFDNIIISEGSADPSVSVAVSPASVLEDSGTGLVYTFTMNSPSVGSTTVNFTIGGTATYSTDYTDSGADTFDGSNGSVIITNGNTTAAVTLTPVADADVEVQETIELMIDSGTGYIGGSPNAATGEITNDDTSNSDPLVAITGLNHNTPDGFSFVAAQDIPGGTEVYFTEEEFDNTTLVFDSGGEAVLKWTVPGAGIPAGDVIVVSETAPDVFSLTCNGASGAACGTITLISGNLATASNGETFYAYADDDPDPSNGVVDIYAVLYTGNSSTPGGSIPAVEDPSGIFLQALVVDGFPAIAPNRTEYDPTKRNIPVYAADFENLANWLHAQTNAPLSPIPFAFIAIINLECEFADAYAAGANAFVDLADDGFGPWGFATTSSDTNLNGSFIGNSTFNGDGVDGNGDGDINSVGVAFGLYANNGQQSDAFRDFDTAMNDGDIFCIDMDNGWVDTGSTVGFSLQNASGENLIEFFFTGGNPNYTLNDNGGFSDTGIGFSDEGFTLKFTQISSGVVDVEVIDLVSDPSIELNGRALINAADGQVISRIRMFNTNAGSDPPRDVYFNNIQHCIDTSDNEPPVLTCPDPFNIEQSADCLAEVPDILALVAVTDNKSDVADIILTQSPAAGEPLPVIGTTTITVTAEDEAGNVAQCTVDVTVIDVTAPVLDCPSDIELFTDPDECTASFIYVYTATDCDVVSFTESHPSSGFDYPLGTTTVTVTATDDSGNAADCSFTVTVIDNELPVPNCPGNIVVNNDPGQCGANVSFGYGATDNCPGVVVNSSIPSGSFFPVGETLVTVTAEDAAGNQADCSFTVTVNDIEAPSITVQDDLVVECPGDLFEIDTRLTVNNSSAAGDYLGGVGTFTIQLTNIPVTADVQLVNDGVDTITDGCEPMADLTGKIALIDRGTCFFTDKVLNAKNAGAIAAIIANSDSGSPDEVVNMSGIFDVDLPAVFVSYNTGVALKSALGVGTVNVSLYDNNVQVSDNCSDPPVVTLTADAVEGSCPNEIIFTYVYTAVDSSGNSASDEYVVTREDTTPPEAPTPPVDVTVQCADEVPAPVELTASDNCQVSITVAPVSYVTPGACPNDFVEIRTWTFTDDCENTSSVSQTITVKDTTAPLPPPPPADVTVQCADEVPVAVDLTAIDNCNGPITVSPTFDFTVGSCQNEFVEVRTWTFSDQCGNTSSVSQTITVKDDTAPVWDFGCEITTTYTTSIGADCPADAAISLNVGDEISVNSTWSVGGITVPNLSGCVSDNCSAASNLILRVTGKTDSNAGACQQELSITFEAEDECGNKAGGFTCVYIFVDDTAPVPPTPPADITVQCADEVPLPVDLTAIDDCAGPITVSPTVDITGGSCPNEYTEVRTWTFDDGCGNISSVSQTITVKDDTAPVWDFGCQIATTYTTNGGADCPADAAISLNVGDEISVNTTWSVGGITVPNLSGCVSDNCSAASNLIIRVTGKSDDNAGACQQTLSVTFEAEDECGNRAGGFTCVYIFVDDTAPVPPTPPADVTVQCADDVPAPVDLTAVDNCAGPITVSPTVVVTSGSCLNEFSEVRTWTFSDGCGNTSTVSQTITVKDDTAPVWDFGCEITTTYTTNGGADCPADAAISLNVGDEISVNQTWTVGGISVPNLSGCVSDNCSAASNLILRVIGKTDDNADICQQTLSITFEAEDECGNIAGGFTCTYVFVDDTDPVITFCPPDITVESEPGECVNTVDIGQALATDNCDPAVSVTNDAPGEFPFGETVVTWTATDACGNSSSCTQTVIVEKINTITEVTVTPSTQQYSDEVTFEASINPGDCPGANGAAAVKVEFFVGSQSMGTADLNLVGEKLVGTLTTALLESPNNPFDASDELGPGLKTVTAEFQGVNPNYNVSNPTTDLEITQEDALVDYTGQTLQATESSNSGNATVPLCVNVQDIADGYRGDIRNATLTIVNRDLPTTDPNYVIYGPVQVADLVFADDETLGTVCYDWNVDIGNQDAIPYTVGFIVDNYYTRNRPEDNTVITVYKPKGDFITGGGFIIPDSSEGEYASTPGLKTNFGFNVKYNKKGTKVQGRVNIIFRVEQPDGSIRVYQIKSNAKPAFGVDISDPNFDFAEFTAKANLSDVTDPLNPISLGGNLTLKVEMTDWGEPGDQDSIGINLTNNSGTLLYSSNWNGTSTDELILSGGNIVIHSGFSSLPTSSANQVDSPVFNLSTEENPFDFKAIIELESDDKSAMVTYTVYDGTNKLIFTQVLPPDANFTFGENVRSGMYLVVVQQGGKVGQIRMIKE